jgi:hypothetical protein
MDFASAPASSVCRYKATLKECLVYRSRGAAMARYEQIFLEQITNIHGTDYTSWQGWQPLMDWVKCQPWKNQFFGGEKIPARLLHPSTLVAELSRYLGG